MAVWQWATCIYCWLDKVYTNSIFWWINVVDYASNFRAILIWCDVVLCGNQFGYVILVFRSHVLIPIMYSISTLYVLLFLVSSASPLYSAPIAPCTSSSTLQLLYCSYWAWQKLVFLSQTVREAAQYWISNQVQSISHSDLILDGWRNYDITSLCAQNAAEVIRISMISVNTTHCRLHRISHVSVSTSD